MNEVVSHNPYAQSSDGRKKGLSRREFLKMFGLATGAFVLGNSWLGEFVEGIEPELEAIPQALSEYQIGWQARPWVWINLAIAAQRLDGVRIAPHEEVSLNKLLGFDEMQGLSRENTDPRKGYIAAQMSDPSKLDGWGYGLCLGSTALFRACLDSPLEITERGTHYDIYPDYFKDMPIGTDAAVYKPDPGDPLPETDLKLRNPTDTPLSLHFGVYDVTGESLHPPEREVSQVTYKATYLDQLVRILRRKVETTTDAELPKQYLPEYVFGNRKIVVRAAVGGTYNDYQVNLSPVKHGDSTYDPKFGTTDYVFNRTLTLGKGQGSRIIYEQFVSNYNKSPLNAPVLGGE